ncbi:MAG: acyltransferase family protein [Methanobrevibacter sp.]|nr:acyltransferase family protein [Methanobrevibacter sp.]MBQ6100208.1 acyltransferase family protein [Methanobrevibacter sp.]
MVKNRIFYYDFLRAFAIIAVILCHVDGRYEFTTASLKLAIPFLLNDIGLMGVPLFLMLTGALLLGRKQSLGDFFKKRFSRIVYPYVF